jgi:hypothetical protein
VTRWLRFVTRVQLSAVLLAGFVTAASGDTLSGRVLTGSAGVVGATVQVRAAEVLVDQTSTDTNGRFAFNLTAGSYVLSVTPPAGSGLSGATQSAAPLLGVADLLECALD